MMIGDALRGEYLLSRDFSQRVTHPLAQEPTVLAPRRSAVKRITVYALSAAASLSAIALAGWIAFFNNPLTRSTGGACIQLRGSTMSTPTSASAPRTEQRPEQTGKEQLWH